MGAPKVSVVIPCFNLGRFLDEAVDSVLAQTFQDFEILVVDDGSTDPDTRRLLDGYARPKTRIVRSDNHGLPAAKNLGVAHTTGPYVCALDADDRLEPAMLERSVAALDDDPSIAFVSHWLRNFGDDTSEWKPTRCDFPALLDVNTVNGAALVRRSALEAVGGFDDAFRGGCEDWDLWISLVERGFPGVILPEVLFQYRRRAGSMSRAMMQGEGHPGLYRRLAQKHAGSYRAHAASLILRRELDIATLRQHIHDLSLEYHRALAPELAGLRDDIGSLERKAGRAGTGPAAADKSARLERALEDNKALRAEADILAQALEVARTRALELDAAAHRAREEALELKASASWRITAPLRAVYEQIRRLAGPRRAS